MSRRFELGATVMDKLAKTSLNYYLSEYLEELKRAGVREVWRDSTRQDAPAPNSVAATPLARRKPRTPSQTPLQTPKDTAPASRVATANILPVLERPAANPVCGGRAAPRKARAARVGPGAVCGGL
ncbi:MAG: hypothetical protein KIG81_01460, partial [Thermoguttaceae bacterium]|nr:hypothetical protein [Thermoguttaceae bacterium]